MQSGMLTIRQGRGQQYFQDSLEVVALAFLPIACCDVPHDLFINLFTDGPCRSIRHGEIADLVVPASEPENQVERPRWSSAS